MSTVIPFKPNPGTFNIWLESQIFGLYPYIAGVQGFVVPNVGDKVLSYSAGNVETAKRVIAVDAAPEYTPKLELIKTQGSDSESPVIYPVGSANLGAVNICYLNPVHQQHPAVFHVDMLFRGVDITYGRLFLGTDLSSDGIVISRNLDMAGKTVNDRIMFRRENPAEPDNLRYVAESFNLDRKLEEDTLVTIMLYNSRDVEIGYYSAAIKYNHAAGNVSSRALFITRIEMVTVFDNPVKDHELLIPISMLNGSFNPRVYKIYQTGQREEIPLNSPNLTIGGWGNHVIGDSGESFPLVVKYRLAAGERSDSVDIYNGGTITANYKAIITDSATSSDYKILVTPVYDFAATNYNLRGYLYNSDYRAMVDVTDHLELDKVFQGTNYVDYQTFNMSVDLRKVPNVESELLVTGSFGMKLNGEPLASESTYYLYPHPEDQSRFFGSFLRVKMKDALGSVSVGIGNGLGGYSQFLEELYYRLDPPYETANVPRAPEPTFCDVTIGDHTVTIDLVNNWDGSVLWEHPKVTQGTFATLKWYLMDNQNKRRDLAICSLPTEVI